MVDLEWIRRKQQEVNCACAELARPTDPALARQKKEGREKEIGIYGLRNDGSGLGSPSPAMTGSDDDVDDDEN